jgi:hypothetical protein
MRFDAEIILSELIVAIVFTFLSQFVPLARPGVSPLAFLPIRPDDHDVAMLAQCTA